MGGEVAARKRKLSTCLSARARAKTTLRLRSFLTPPQTGHLLREGNFFCPCSAQPDELQLPAFISFVSRIVLCHGAVKGSTGKAETLESEHSFGTRSGGETGWVPSWKGSDKDTFSEEDHGQPHLLSSSPEHSRECGNHCAPLLEVIELSTRFGSQKFMVFPLLRPFNQPRIQTFGEFAAFFTQISEGIRFLHQRNVAHRYANNIKFTAAQHSPRYYFVGFGLSRQYPSRDTMDEPLPGEDESAPEHRSRRQLCNPFHTDIYYIGNLVRKEFIERCNGFEFMEDLVASMTRGNPAERPPIEEVLEEFSRIRASLSKRKLRSVITSKNTSKVFGIIRQPKLKVAMDVARMRDSYLRLLVPRVVLKNVLTDERPLSPTDGFDFTDNLVAAMTLDNPARHLGPLIGDVLEVAERL
ncbi:hypothetical protein EDB84DRAFT_1660604 [Lactarius hengduanensis]|nr:hypothetical protein EDB84DRAFT_1660604 [Lactarius hengduanensis]